PDALAYYGSAATANGRVSTARVDLATVTLEGAPEQPLTAWVNDGAMPHSLLGMRFLERFSKIELMGDRMILQR
ncbi:MAG: retroviral-like aspartic protease family protein, partial [Paracoccaceae bacterium]|nr:retroviral-like aspartic protease family protein [Paracoccaceae bacterium]